MRQRGEQVGYSSSSDGGGGDDRAVTTSVLLFLMMNEGVKYCRLSRGGHVVSSATYKVQGTGGFTNENERCDNTTKNRPSWKYVSTRTDSTS